MSRRRSPGGGFTLIEVLVALVIVAVGMSALMGALTSSAKTVSYMQDKTFAEWVALNQITNLRITLQKGQVPPTGKSNGDIDFANRSWHWRQEVVASQVPGIMRIDVKVRPKEIKGGDDDSWYVTVSGLAGNALAAPGTGPVMSASGSTEPTIPGIGAGTGTNPGTSLGGNGAGTRSSPGGNGTGTGTGRPGNQAGSTPQ